MSTLTARPYGSLSFPQKILRLNWALILLVGAIAGTGFLMLYSVAGGDFDPWAGRQITRFGAGMVIMSFIALAVSACSAKEKGSTSLWIGVWIFGGIFGRIGAFTQPWLQNISLSHNLHQLAVYIFNLKQDMIEAGEVIPAIGQAVKQLDKLPAFRRPPRR